MVEIRDEDSARAWLETEPAPVRLWLATRCALRAVPALAWTTEPPARQPVLETFRALLTASAASTCPLESRAALTDALAAAHRAVAEVTLRATSTDFSSADATLGACGSALLCAMQTADAAVAADAVAKAAAAAALSELAMAGKPLSQVGKPTLEARSQARIAAQSATDADTKDPCEWPALWHGSDMPLGLARGLRVLSDEMRSGPQMWSFWLEWYEAILRGEPLPWDLGYQIVLQLSDEDWAAGPEHVAERIRAIQQSFLTTALPQAETINSDEDGLFFVERVVFDADEMIARIFAQLDFSLEMALRGHNMSGFDELCVGYKYIDHTRRNCRDDPNAVHMNLRLAREIIEGKLADGTYGNEDGLRAFVTALARHEIQLRADHPEVRAAHETFVAQKLRELDEDRRLQIAGEFRSLQEDTRGQLEEEFGLDAETLETGQVVEAQADAVKRSGGRSQKMAILVHAGNAIQKAEDSAAWKASGMVLRLQKLANLLSSLL